MNRLETLNTLGAVLRGEGSPCVDWMDVIALANRASLTPALLAPLEVLEARGAAPADLMTFVRDVERRNRERNIRLLEMLSEALEALNAADIVPVLLKGGVLVVSHGPYLGARILADMDLLVRPGEVERAIGALAEAGFGVMARHPGADVHCVAELGRPQDPGMIDLHQRPAGPPAAAEIADLRRHCALVAVGRGQALTPSPELLLYFTVLHDQLHDGDFWRGAFDLRHLMDFAVLSKRDFDWDRLGALCPTALIRRMACTQVLAAVRWAGAVAPERFTARPAARAHLARCFLQHRWPALVGPLGLAAILAETPNLLAHRRFDRQGREQVLAANVHDGPNAGRLERLRSVFDTAKAGKV